MREIIDACYAEAKSLLGENLDILKNMTAELLKVEILEGDALAEFLGKDRITDYSKHMTESAPVGDDHAASEHAPDEEDPDNVGQNLDRAG